MNDPIAFLRALQFVREREGDHDDVVYTADFGDLTRLQAHFPRVRCARVRGHRGKRPTLSISKLESVELRKSQAKLAIWTGGWSWACRVDLDLEHELMLILDPVPCRRSPDALRISLARGESFHRDETLDPHTAGPRGCRVVASALEPTVGCS